MGTNKVTGGFIRDVVIAAIVSVLGAVALKYQDLPTRVSVVESQQIDIKDTVKSIDGKLDLLISRAR